MKKTIAIIIIISLMLAGCGAKEKPSEPKLPRQDASRFVTVEVGTLSMWDIVADRETGVMYAVSHGTNNLGTFTLLVDADGKPLIWEGVNDQIER